MGPREAQGDVGCTGENLGGSGGTVGEFWEARYMKNSRSTAPTAVTLPHRVDVESVDMLLNRRSMTLRARVGVDYLQKRMCVRPAFPKML